MYLGKISRNQTLATRTLVPIVTTLLLTVAFIPLGTADDTPVWIQTERIVSLNGEPIKSASCPVPVEEACGSSQTDFGGSVAIDGDTLVVGEPNEQKIHFYTEWIGGWSHAVTFEGPEGFGSLIEIDGDTVLAARTVDGGVYVFERTGSEWGLEEIITIPGGLCPANHVAIDGSRMVVNDLCASNVHVFESTQEGWLEMAVLSVDGAFLLGLGVDLEGDKIFAKTLFQGLYAFDWTGSEWISSLITPVSPILFGYNGEQLAYLKGGQVRIFEEVAGNWENVVNLTPQDASPFDGIERFGGSFAFEGNTIVVGAPSADASPGSPETEDEIEDECLSQFGYQLCAPPRPGAAYVFERTGDDWAQTAKLSGDPVGSPQFGDAVAVDPQGERIVASAPNSLLWSLGGHLDVDPEDSVHVFERVELGSS